MRTPVRLIIFVLAVIVGLSFLGAWYWGFDLLSHFRVYLAGVGLILLLCALLARERLGALVAGLVVAANMIPIAPYVSFADNGIVKGDFRVVVMNLWNNNPKTEPGVDFLRRVDADVIFLLEVAPHWSRAIDALKKIYPHRHDLTACSIIGHCNMTLISKRPWVSITDKNENSEAPANIRAKFHTAVGKLTLIGAHLLYPMGKEYTEIQKRQLDAIAGMVNDISGPLILAGDFNFTPWSVMYGRLINATGLLRSEGGILPSWKSKVFPIQLPIDHVFFRLMKGTVHAWTGPEIGSDHLPLIADIVFH